MKFIEVTTAREKKILINLDNVISISTTDQDDMERGKFAEILLSNGGICKVKNSYEYLKRMLSPDTIF